ncbi:MAG: DNRLRE domain-containing protein [Deltaproteobacteria bacterium]|jgi:hypothetical protein|nr:DNRLRE domain-containing protein [Deltaproteobacteria bacterium]
MKRLMISLTIIVVLLAIGRIAQAQGAISYETTIELNNTTGIDASVNWTSQHRDTNYNDVALYVSGSNAWMSGDSLLKFNLESIPSSAIITSARFILTHWQPGGIQGYGHHYLYQYMCDWSEDSITYNISKFCPKGPLLASQYMWYAIDSEFNRAIPEWVVQGWVDGSIDNNGVYMGFSGWGWHYYRSSEFDDPNERPKLILTYDLYPIEVLVDIKPQACPNPVNVKSQGVLPVAVLGTEDFDVTEIDLVSVRLAGIVPVRSSIEDVNADEFDDLILKFDTQEIISTLEEVADREELVLQLTGVLLDGTPIEGNDCITILSKG